MKRKYELEWTNKYLTNHATSIDEMQTMLGDAAAFVRELRDFGDKVEVDFKDSSKDIIRFYTDDPGIAEEYGFSTYLHQLSGEPTTLISNYNQILP